MRLDLSDRALLDLEDFAVYFAREDTRLAARFIRQARSTMESLLDAPKKGRLHRFRDPALLDLRSCAVAGFSDYLIFYSVRGRTVHIHRVLHGARNLRRVFGPVRERRR